MSHIVSVATQMKDERAVQRACETLGLAPATHGTFTVFSRQVTGLGFQLKNWSHPCVANLKTGELQYDNFNGAWGAIETLHKFQQRYALEAAKLTAEDSGQTYGEEYQDEQGRICFDIQDTPKQHVLLGADSGSGNGPTFAL